MSFQPERRYRRGENPLEIAKLSGATESRRQSRWLRDEASLTSTEFGGQTHILNHSVGRQGRKAIGKTASPPLVTLTPRACRLKSGTPKASSSFFISCSHVRLHRI